MTIGRTKPPGWSYGEKLTADEINALDVAIAKALDRTADGDTLSGIITVASTGGLLFQASSQVSGVVGSSGLTWIGDFTFDGSPVVSAGNQWGYSSRSVTRPAHATMVNQTTSAVNPDSLNVGAGETMIQELSIPDGATLTDVALTLDPAAATPPSGPVSLGVYYRDLTTGDIVVLKSGTADPTAGAFYGLPHTFLASATGGVLSHTVVAATRRYFAKVIGESGGGASFVSCYGASVVFTTSAVDEGAS